MEQNLFEELQDKKQRLVALATKAAEYGWITAESRQGIVNKLENDVLTIGVIGQMKCGKSTFLNSFVFEDNVLPAATTPMTAALSVITYGESKKIVAEFYTKDEWEEQKLTASRSWSDVQGNALEESKVKAAKELVEKAGKLGPTLNSYLGKTQEDEFGNLIDYVGADGKYISITKSVTIYYPKEYLKGVEIVDTPGFNDPIVSREERTKAFLKKADVVLMMLYAGRPFDATDREILFQNVRQCGIGKVIIGINKYDIPYENEETEDEIKEYVKQEIRKACKMCEDDSLSEILKQAEPIPLSAEMALLSELPMSKITANEDFQFAWKRACRIFEISSQSQMREKSHLGKLASAVKQLAENEKEKILFAKPVNAIMAAGNGKKMEVEKSLREYEGMMINLGKPDKELEEKKENLEKAKRRLNKKIDLLGCDIDNSFEQIIRKGKNEMEDEVDNSCRKMQKIIDNWGRLEDIEKISPKLDGVKQTLLTRTLKRKVEGLSDKAKTEIKKCVRDFMAEVDDVLMKYVPDFDPGDFMKELEHKINLDIENEDMFSFDSSTEDENYGWSEFIFRLLNKAMWGALGLAGNVLNHSENVNKLHQYVNSISGEFNPTPFLETIYKNKDKIIDSVKDSFFTELIEPMIQQIDDIRSQAGSKEAKLADAKTKADMLRKQKSKMETEMNEMLTLNWI
ncbi:dynamin family protein [Parabacteroides sp. ZJ-118]|uniref:dynamin family protein n=1 Tax=Parabacteroides sp. ZJ-118 TaxID=2709398 RepID=UPI0013EDDDFE|nr:dynamin family protein [Parabacteroides sp. ZJ-118]